MFSPTPSPAFNNSPNVAFRRSSSPLVRTSSQMKRGRGQYEYDEEYDDDKKQRENTVSQSLLVVRYQRGG